ncbi:hypothetical protein BRUCa_1329 [Brucella melitensis]
MQQKCCNKPDGSANKEAWKDANFAIARCEYDGRNIAHFRLS